MGYNQSDELNEEKRKYANKMREEILKRFTPGAAPTFIADPGLLDPVLFLEALKNPDLLKTIDDKDLLKQMKEIANEFNDNDMTKILQKRIAKLSLFPTRPTPT